MSALSCFELVVVGFFYCLIISSKTGYRWSFAAQLLLIAGNAGWLLCPGDMKELVLGLALLATGLLFVMKGKADERFRSIIASVFLCLAFVVAGMLGWAAPVELTEVVMPMALVIFVLTLPWLSQTASMGGVMALTGFACLFIACDWCFRISPSSDEKSAYLFFDEQKLFQGYYWKSYPNGGSSVSPFLLKRELSVIPPGTEVAFILYGRDTEGGMQRKRVLLSDLGTFPDRLEGLFRANREGHSENDLLQYVRSRMFQEVEEPRSPEFWEPKSLESVALKLAAQYLGEYGSVKTARVSKVE